VSGPVSLVTGAAGGMSRAVVERLTGAGTRVGALDLDVAGLQSLTSDTVLPPVVDVTDDDAVRAVRADSAAPADFAARVPAGRTGTPAEVADPVAYLLSSAATYVNGAVLSVDGGSGA